ncbi:MAG: RNA polymerase factor sigma-54 [Bauldia sp.]|uniref:RNA polymerase factor sigma-54 n=1 Tax=Bauldia sp. TaxID=2575872 RepID=UPI001E119A16|nr:RNA polymerase factor sigma-54 [Bauldia sp.]MCB1496456.1 RNA polymerase factor sigma-54 [Bauldia sp.]
MALSQKLEFRQSQLLVMTPQLMQAIKLLQLSNLDLVAYVEAELERNPLLDRAPEEDGTPPAENRGEEEPSGADRDASGDGDGGDWLETGLDGTGEAGEPKLDTDLANVFPDDNSQAAAETAPALPAESWSVAPSRQPVSSDDYNLEAFVAGETTLADHLANQLGLAVCDPTLRLIGGAIISEIDEAGYFRADIEALAEQLGAGADQARQVLSIVQGFEPSGVGARDLAECLAIQLRERDRLDPAMAALVGNLDLVARRDLNTLMKLCGVDGEDLVEMIAELRALNPKPGNAFGDAVVQPVVPDVMVRPANDGGWHVELNTATLPRVLFDQTYYARVSKGRHSEKDDAFLTECMQTAKWLVKSLDQRARTILKVATEIVRQQDAFLAHGVQHLRPLNLKTVAEAIGMHESTVSRVTSNKYMATTRGVFELKYFFTAAIASSEGGVSHSAEAVRHRIKRLIDEEPADTILSDDAIVRTLRDSGIDIARRTVAKYREALRIPSSVQRRREKQAAL